MEPQQRKIMVTTIIIIWLAEGISSREKGSKGWIWFGFFPYLS